VAGTRGGYPRGPLASFLRVPPETKLPIHPTHCGYINMGLNRTPTNVLEARGAYINHPERKADRVNEPRPTAPLGPPPKHFTKEEKKIWKELVRIAPAGVLTICDRWTVERCVQLVAKMRAGTMMCAEGSQLITCMSKLGMTPADRSKVSATPEPPQKFHNPEDEFIQ
jgi:hypothetical protein